MNLEFQTAFVPDTPGAFLGVPMEVYQSAPGLSKSALDRLNESPADFDAWRKGLIPDAPTWPMRYGALLHAHVFGGATEFHTRPDVYGPDGKDWNNNAKECRAWMQAHSDRPVLDTEEALTLLREVEALRTHYRVAPLLTGGHAEVSIFARHEDTGKLLKGRADYIIPCDGGVDVVDLKSLADASTRELSKTVLYRGYHFQAAVYRYILRRLGVSVRRFILIALQKGDRPKVNVRVLDQAAIEVGEHRLEQSVGLYMRCTLAGRWPTWPDEDEAGEIQSIDLPSYCYESAEILSGMTAATTD